MIHPKGLRRIMVDAVAYFAELKCALNQPFHIIDARRTELNNDIEDANTYLVEQCQLEPVPLIPTECIFHVGSSVESVVGVGMVEKFNNITGIYRIRLTDWTLTESSRARVHARRGSQLAYEGIDR